MVKKSNKTEHVMRLITKDPVEPQIDEIPDISLLASEGNELNYKTKLKIEIEPEIEIKGSNGGEHSSAGQNDRLEGGKQVDIQDQNIVTRKGAVVHENQKGSIPLQKEEEERVLIKPDPLFPFVTTEDVTAGNRGSGSNTGINKSNSIQDMPDGVPFEKRNEDIMTSVLNSADKASAQLESMDEVRASIRRDEIKRGDKIDYVDQIIEHGHKITNLSEVLTIDLMPSIIEKLGACKCQTCAANILALALNMLPPRYITTIEGKQYMKLVAFKSQHELDVVQAITKACLKVIASPRHNIGE